MSAKILQINYKLNGPRAEYEKENLPYAQPIADIPGLRWKVWIINEAQSEAGGIYLFEDDAAEPVAMTPEETLENLEEKRRAAAEDHERDRKEGRGTAPKNL